MPGPPKGNFITGAEQECQDVQGLLLEAYELPMQGIHVGGGRHVKMTGDPTSPGWTTQQSEVIKHPTEESYACEVPPSPPKGRLSGQDWAKLKVEAAKAKGLAAGWEKPVP